MNLTLAAITRWLQRKAKIIRVQLLQVLASECMLSCIVHRYFKWLSITSSNWRFLWNWSQKSKVEIPFLLLPNLWVWIIEFPCSQSPLQSESVFASPDQFSSVQLLSRVRVFATPWTTARQVSLSITNSQSLPKLMSIESMMPSNHFIFCFPILLCLQSFPTSGFFQMSQLFASGGQSIGVSASTSVLPEHPGLISFRMDWLDLLVVQGILKSLIQHHC